MFARTLKFIVVVSFRSFFCDSLAAPRHLIKPIFTSRSIRSSISVSKVFPLPLASSKSSAADDIHQKMQQSSLLFGKFRISPQQVFYSTNLTAAIVNLRPIVPGHVLVIPKRVSPRLHQLTSEEYIDLWQSVRVVQRALETHYNADGSNVAVQDGACAGQSVPHVHVHILPRVKGDFERNDDIYDELQDWAPVEGMGKKEGGLHVVEDSERRDRSLGEMEEEAETYRGFFGNNDEL